MEKYYDYIALEDKIRRAEIINEEDFKNFRAEVYNNTFFTNRRKIYIEDLINVLKGKHYEKVLIGFINSNKISFNF